MSKRKIEKSDIYNAFAYSKDSFSKTGEQIKQQINSVVMPRLNADLSLYSEKANNLLQDCGGTPKMEISSYWRNERKINVPFKRFDWCETFYPERDSVRSGFETLSADDDNKSECQPPASKFEAQKRCEYNECVEMICNIMVDIKACEVLLHNVEDKKSYDLNMSQIVALDF